MLPLELTIEGLRSYCERVNLDFRGRNEIAIIGDTGSGKSSIIEAITYALYGQTTFSVLNRELINDNSSQLRVVLHFQVGAEEWKVVRILRRSESGKAGGSSAELQRLGENGKKLEFIENVRPVNERLEALIGMSREAFLRTRVLPQGRFAQLLVEDDPRMRSAILRQVWRTDDVEEAGKIVTATYQKLVSLRARIVQTTMSYPEDPRLHEKELLNLVAKTDEASKNANKKEEQVVAAVNDLSVAKDDIDKATVVLSELRALDGKYLFSALEPLMTATNMFEGRMVTLQHRQTTAAKALAGIPSDEDGLSLTEITKVLATLETVGPRAQDALTAASKFRAHRDVSNQKNIAARDAAKLVAIESKEVEVFATHGPALEQAKTEAERWLGEIKKQYGKAAHSYEDLKDAQNQLSEKQHAYEEIEQALNLLLIEDTGGHFTTLESDHDQSIHDDENLSTFLFQSLKPGDPCPVCKRNLRPGWEPPDISLGKAVSQVLAAKNLEEKLQEVKIKLFGQQDSLNELLSEARQRFQKATVVAAEDRVAFKKLIESGLLVLGSRKLEEITQGSLSDKIDLVNTQLSIAGNRNQRDLVSNRRKPNNFSCSTDILRGRSLKPLNELLKLIEACVSVIVDDADTHSRTLQRKLQEIAKQEIACEVTSEAVAESKQYHKNSEQTATEALSRLRETVASIPGFYQPSLMLSLDPSTWTTLDLDAVDQQISTARERVRQLEWRAQERDKLGKLLPQIALDQQDLREEQELQVATQIHRIVKELNKNRDVLARSANVLGLYPDLPDSVTSSCNKELLVVIARFESINSDLLKCARDRKERATEKLLAANAKLQAFGKFFNVIELSNVPKHVRELAENARYVAREAQESSKRFTALVEQLVSLHELLDDIRDRERVFSDLEAALKDGAFLKWLTLRRSRSLLIHASGILEKMSQGRYAFMEPENELDRWQVLDRESGRSRSPASLSGGEQFAASLALALGMVEMIERSGSRLESLFIDEGFGSLDLHNLEAALNALRVAVNSGRMVVLVSHVQAVAEKMANVATVVRHQTGSRIEWLSKDPQGELAELDVHSSALEGLL